ncbi:hypothetical protein R1T08_17085 [Streptomyces sp. SBC-4]|nr:hypothetical protein [Streptomyces sp. SBC-4]MDV5145875.1 hypothetical protein [Streptomyces sp. SBC-4]
MSARTWLLARLTGALVPQERAEQELDAYRDEVLYGAPLFLAEFDSVETEVHLTLDDARAACDDIAKAVASGRTWEWAQTEDGVYVQFWTHEDDDRPLHLTGGTVTEVRVQHPESASHEAVAA